MENPAPVMRQDDQDEEEPAGDRRHGEEVEGDDPADVVLEERAPRLGRRPASARDQPRDRALGGVEPEFQEFAVNPWGPERIGVGQSGQARRKLSQNNRSDQRIAGFGRVRRYMANC